MYIFQRSVSQSIAFVRICLSVLKIKFFAENQCKTKKFCVDLKNSVRRLKA